MARGKEATSGRADVEKEGETIVLATGFVASTRGKAIEASGVIAKSTERTIANGY